MKQTAAQPTVGPTREQISQRARQLWEQEGRPEGRAEIHWLMAETQLRETMTQRPRI